MPYGAYDTTDGKQVVIGIQNDREWHRFANNVPRTPEMCTDERAATTIARGRNRDFVDQLVNATASGLTASELLRLLDENNIADARLNDLSEAAEHPQLTDKDRWVQTPTPVGPVPTLRQSSASVARATRRRRAGSG